MSVIVVGVSGGKISQIVIAQILFRPPQKNYSVIWYFSDQDYDQNIHYMWSSDIDFSANYHLSVYDMTYLTLGPTYTEIIIASEKGEYNPPNKDV